MIVIYPPGHAQHRPPSEIFNGNRDAHAEVPSRIERIKDALAQIPGVEFSPLQRFPVQWLKALHNHRYIAYLSRCSTTGSNAYVYPSVFPYAPGQTTKHAVGMRGQYSFDMYTPVNMATYQAAYESATAALTAASLVRQGAKVSYALCRPPGHHAEYAKMGGYCYFGNAAIAAHYLSGFGRVAVLDIDVHHGNGTQALLYGRADVFTVSIHGDPDYLFPYFTGRAHERGVGKGMGYNLNIPLPLGTTDRTYHTALGHALDAIGGYNPDYLVVSVGYDAHVRDPIGGFKLSSSYYRNIAQSIAALHKPSVLIQEGGYNVEVLGEISSLFAGGFML